MVLGLLAHVTPWNFFKRILRSEALVYTSYFFRTAVLRKLFDIRFSYNHCNFSRVCLLVKMPSKTVTRSILWMVSCTRKRHLLKPTLVSYRVEIVFSFSGNGRFPAFLENRSLPSSFSWKCWMSAVLSFLRFLYMLSIRYRIYQQFATSKNSTLNQRSYQRVSFFWSAKKKSEQWTPDYGFQIETLT